MTSENSKTSIDEDVPAKRSSETTPIWALVKRLFQHIGAVPWLGFGAIGTGVGVTLLYTYFLSINFIPADIPSIFSASIFVAMLTLAFCVLVLLSLIAPLWGYVATGLHPTRSNESSLTSSFSVSGLWALQCIGVGCFMLWIGHKMSLDCKSGSGHLLTFGGVTAVVGLIGWVVHEVMTCRDRGAWWKRLHHVAWVCTLSAFPFFVLFLYLIPSQGATSLHIGVFFTTWLLTVAITSVSLHRIPVWGSALIVLCALPLLTISIPVLQGTPHLLPTHVAQLAGIRSKQIDELRVPQKTCELVRGALGSSALSRPFICGPGEWGKFHAQVLSNLGERWLIELQLDGPYPEGRNGAVQVTIPSEGVHTVRQMPAQPTEQAAGCRM